VRRRAAGGLDACGAFFFEALHEQDPCLALVLEQFDDFRDLGHVLFDAGVEEVGVEERVEGFDVLGEFGREVVADGREEFEDDVAALGDPAVTGFVVLAFEAVFALVCELDGTIEEHEAEFFWARAHDAAAQVGVGELGGVVVRQGAHR
jgi:hypothetical protein